MEQGVGVTVVVVVKDSCYLRDVDQFCMGAGTAVCLGCDSIFYFLSFKDLYV